MMNHAFQQKEKDEDPPQLAMPAFGTWDSASTESNTHIFHKVRNEKKTMGPLWVCISSAVAYWGSGRFDKGENKVETGVEDPSATLSGLKMFSLPELNAATNNFSDDRIIGEGNYSVVYKGVLHDGLVVALKVLLDSHFADSDMRLLDEVKIGAKLNHKNVVKHLGYCMDVGTKLVEYFPLHDGKKVLAQKRTHVLVLHYLPNGSLGDIFKGEIVVGLSFCFRIIQEIAQGVHYLHGQHIIHGDLKPDNILFGKGMNPVIIDFGVSIILKPDVDEEILDTPVGTLDSTMQWIYGARNI